MDNECRLRTLKIAIASYDRKELRVQKHYLEEEGPFIGCTCFQSGERLLRELQDENTFDVVILCSEMEDMTGLEFLMNARKLEHQPILLIFDEDAMIVGTAQLIVIKVIIARQSRKL